MTMTQEHPAISALDGPQLHHWAQLVDEFPPRDWSRVLANLAGIRPGKYRITRLNTCWLISDMDPNTDTEPTFVADTVAQAVSHILNPGPRFGKTLGPPPTL